MQTTMALFESRYVTIIGNGSATQSGTYVLRIRVRENLALAFGRFKRGKIISIPAGEYIYTGSALGEKGAVTLARRLIRHATRSGDHPPHIIRAHMLKHFPSVGLGTGDLLPKRAKTLFWNIDYLLDQPSAELTHIIAIRRPQRLEACIARFIEDEPCTHIVEKGLGANDAAGSTHLLRVEGGEIWWRGLPERLSKLTKI